MDFRIYVYKINKGINSLITKKIINVFLFVMAIVCLLLTKPFCISWLNIEPVFLKDLTLFDFEVQNNMIYSIVWITIASLWFLIWLSCISTTSKIKKNMRIGSGDKISSTGGLAFSNILDLICIGWIIPIARRKSIIMDVYNFGVDDWLNNTSY